MRARMHRLAALALTVSMLAPAVSCTQGPRKAQAFTAPEDAVHAVVTAADQGKGDRLRAIFGPDVDALVDSSDPVAARRRREVFTVAAAEQWRLVDERGGKRLLVGHEEWPFPVPLVKESDGWRFDTTAGVEEVLARRIGRNELSAIRICLTYVLAQRLYARQGHDGKPAALYARSFRSDPGLHNGLYWAAVRGEPRSPLGDLLAQAADERRPAAQAGLPAPFYGYFFRILTAQGRSAPGGARNYLVDGEMSGGFALVAWPAKYDSTGIMTFVVNHDGLVHQKDLGPETAAAAGRIAAYDPDASWSLVE